MPKHNLRHKLYRHMTRLYFFYTSVDFHTAIILACKYSILERIFFLAPIFSCSESLCFGSRKKLKKINYRPYIHWCTSRYTFNTCVEKQVQLNIRVFMNFTVLVAGSGYTEDKSIALRLR